MLSNAVEPKTYCATFGILLFVVNAREFGRFFKRSRGRDWETIYNENSNGDT